MNKNQAKEHIVEILNSKFNLDRFELFISNLLNEYEPRETKHSGNLIPEAFREHINHFRRIGKYTDPDGEEMDILVIQTVTSSKIERTRTALRNFVVNRLKKFGDKSYALAAFYSKEDDGLDWRLSFIKIDIEKEKNEKGRIKAKEVVNPAKRFSFLVGENENAHTAQKQVLPLLVNDHSNPLIIKEKDGDGSVEGAFSIEKVTDEFYEQYKELYIKLIENAPLAITLKNEGLDPVRFVKKLLGQIVFLYFLQKKGWLGVLKDQKMGEGPKDFLRKKFDGIDEKDGNYFNDFLRFLFYDALAKEHNDLGIKYFYEKLDCKIPFLNGGLFEAEYEDWDTLDLKIDNVLFSNPNAKNKAGDRGTGILDVFDRYNFTIREDEPLEKEVAVDPEMLGKVFENLLDVTDRKSKGAFYTPREIVNYMCQQSLIHYLDNTVNNCTVSYQSIDSNQPNLFGGSSDKRGNLKIEVENKGDKRVPKKDIEKLIRQGHLVLENETTVTGKGKETNIYKYKIPESIRKNAKVLDEALTSIKICDPAIGSGAFPVGLLQEIVTARSVLYQAYLKEKIKSSKSSNSANSDSDNYSPYNLKRHAIQQSIYGVDIDPSAIDIARLRLWLSMIVDEEDYETIEALPNLDYKIVCGNSLIGFPKNWKSPAFDKIEALKNSFFNETDLARKKEIKNQIDIEIQKRLDTSERVFGYKVDFDFKLYFSEVWHEKGGFDVVIGNPPYLEFKLPKNQKSQYKTYNSLELYAFFYEKGVSYLLRDNGIISFITGALFIKGMKFRSLRKYLLDYTHPEYFNVVGDNVFKNVQMPTSIFVGKKSSAKWSFSNFISGFNILEKIENDTKPLKDFVFIQRGFEIGRDKVQNNETKYPFVTGSEVVPWGIKRLKYISEEVYQSNKKEDKYFKNDRILIRETGSRLICLLLNSKIYSNRSLYSMILKDSNSTARLKFILVILNSEISQYYYSLRFKSDTEIFPKIRIGQAKLLPIKNKLKIEDCIISLADIKTHLANQDCIESEFFLELVNAVSYELYFPEELKSANKEILKHLGDLKSISNEMSEEQKLAIIQSEFERLYDPRHPVRNNIETLDSVEEVRIIKEALK